MFDSPNGPLKTLAQEVREKQAASERYPVNECSTSGAGYARPLTFRELAQQAIFEARNYADNLECLLGTLPSDIPYRSDEALKSLLHG